MNTEMDLNDEFDSFLDGDIGMGDIIPNNSRDPQHPAVEPVQGGLRPKHVDDLKQISATSETELQELLDSGASEVTLRKFRQASVSLSSDSELSSTQKMLEDQSKDQKL